MASLEGFDKLPANIQEHIKSVLESLYKDGPDENPVHPDDSVLGVVMLMSAGVRRVGKPELTPLESEIIMWAYSKNFNMPTKWPSELIMLKEIPVYVGAAITEEQIAGILDIQGWEVKPRMSTPDGLKICWVGAVVKSLALEYWVTVHEAKGEDPGFRKME